MLAFLVLLILLIACVFGAQRLAMWKGRSAVAWMWTTAMLGPVPLAVLALLPSKRQRVPA